MILAIMADTVGVAIQVVFLVGLSVEGVLAGLLLSRYPNNDTRKRAIDLVDRLVQTPVIRIFRNLFAAFCFAVLVFSMPDVVLAPFVALAGRVVVVRMHDIQTKLHDAREKLKKAE